MENAIVENRPNIWVVIHLETQLGNIFKLGNIAINLKIKVMFPTLIIVFPSEFYFEVNCVSKFFFQLNYWKHNFQVRNTIEDNAVYL